MSEQVDFQLGDDYIDIRPLAEGGMGTLFRAYRRGLGVEVVIKRVRSQFVGRLDQKAEANILKRLKHRYLPRIYDIINRDDGYFYTVMDYIPGINMQQYVRQNGPADQKSAHKWACQLCEVVAYLHEQDPPIIHCDIKPSNLMITPAGDLCLIDFNTSLIFSDGVLAVGATPGYAAPEQYTRPGPEETVPSGETTLAATAATLDAATAYATTAPSRKASFSAAVSRRAGGYGTVTKRTDVYGIGATLYYLVTGHTPERALDPVTPLADYAPPISDTFRAIIQRAIAKPQEQRFSDADEMLRALQDVDELDARMRRCRTLRRVSRLILGLMFALSLACTLYGVWLLRAERDNRYLTMVSQGETLAGEGDYQGAADLLQQAITAFPARAEAYLTLSAQLYGQGYYTEAEDLIRNALASGSLQPDTLPADQVGDLLYVQANCAYELQDYSGAVSLYREALQYRQDNSAYFRGLALAQARAGDLEGAQATLESLQQGGSALDCEIVSAEIHTVSGEYETALAEYRDILTRTDDPQILSRAYLSAAEVCQALGDLDGRIALLQEAVDRLGDSGALQEETLAQALTEKAAQDPDHAADWYARARTHLEHLVDSGRGNTLTALNLAVVLENLDDFAAAESRLLALRETAPSDYRVYMRLAFLYADWQSQRPADQRDYSNVTANADLARQYYAQAQANGTSDPEMTRLESLLEQLQISGWIG